MNIFKKTIRFFLIAISLLTVSNFTAPGKVAHAAVCNSQTECAQMLKDNQNAVSTQKIQLNSAQEAIDTLNAQIGVIQNGINIQNQQIDLTTQQINTVQAQVVQEIDQLKSKKADLNETIVAYYENGNNQSTLEALVGSNSLTDAIDKAKYMESISSNLTDQVNQVNKLIADLQNKQNDLQKQKTDLETQKGSLASQKANLASQQQTQQNLASNAQGTLNSLKSQQSAISVRLQQYAVIRGTSAWGTQIVSNARAPWYETQLGDYSPLGDSSDYNVNNAGCYITSLAMVANFYGHNINVSNIASHSEYFSDGNLQGWVPSAAYGLNVSGGQSWSTVNQQIDAGKPVIARLQLGGGTHFIVLDGRSGDKYLMQDPLGTNRGYNISQVSDLRIVSPK